jgi:hypothetical protein
MDVDSQSLGLLFEKRACSGTADLVHFEIQKPASFRLDILGVLTSYLKDRVHIGEVMSGRG